MDAQAAGHSQAGNRRPPEQSLGPYAGLYAEFALAALYGWEVDTSVRPYGDPGWDLEAPCGSIDVKAILGMHPQNVIHRAGTRMADYCVFARYLQAHDVVAFIGWLRGRELAAAPVGTLPGRTIRNHILDVARLHCMRTFEQLAAPWGAA